MKSIKQVGIPVTIVILAVAFLILCTVNIKIILEALKYFFSILIFIIESISIIWLAVLVVRLILYFIAAMVYTFFDTTNNIERSTQVWTIEKDKTAGEEYLAFPGEKRIQYNSYLQTTRVSRQIPKTDLILVKWLFVYAKYDKHVRFKDISHIP